MFSCYLQGPPPITPDVLYTYEWIGKDERDDPKRNGKLCVTYLVKEYERYSKDDVNSPTIMTRVSDGKIMEEHQGFKLAMARCVLPYYFVGKL
jgi:hypothetical protein